MFLGIVFFLIIEHDSCEGTVFKSPEGILTVFGQVKTAFPQERRSGQKNLFKKKAMVPVKKKFFARFSSKSRQWPTLSNKLLGITRLFGIFGASYEIVCLTP